LIDKISEIAIDKSKKPAILYINKAEGGAREGRSFKKGF
jgi:hypothetical protein